MAANAPSRVTARFALISVAVPECTEAGVRRPTPEWRCSWF